MSIIKRKNNNNLFPSFLDDVLGNDLLNPSADFGNVGFNVPAANIKEHEDKFMLELAAPGKSKEDFNVELDNDVLTISSEHEDKKEDKNGESFTRKEYSYESFTRSFTIPESVDSSQIKANYQNGILKFNLPKREEAKTQPKRMIDIS